MVAWSGRHANYCGLAASHLKTNLFSRRGCLEPAPTSTMLRAGEVTLVSGDHQGGRGQRGLPRA